MQPNNQYKGLFRRFAPLGAKVPGHLFARAARAPTGGITLQHEAEAGPRFFVARQPILDIAQNVYAYELLYRSDEKHNRFDTDVNAHMASSEIIMSSFQNMGIANITRGKRAFINFTDKLILEDVATLFPSDQLVVEVLETVDPSTEVLEKLVNLKQAGYTIALDDYEYSPSYALLNKLADVVKIDFLSMPLEEIKKTINHFDKKKVKLLAEKVEDQAAFEAAKEMGFSLFQGYFFAKPTIVSGRRIDPLKINYIQLVRHVNQDDLDFKNLAQVVRRDVALSFRLLRLINSAYYGLRNEIKDIQYALAYLGEQEVRKWISLIAMVRCCEGKADEIIYQSLIRARFMELFGALDDKRADSETLFLTGLFSMIDVVMEKPMDEVIAQLYVSKDVSEALVDGEGYAAEILRMVCFYEMGMFEESIALCDDTTVSPDRLPELYLDALEWCKELQP